MKRATIKIEIASRVRIPLWIGHQDRQDIKVAVQRRQVNGTKFRSIQIRQAIAYFLPCGYVGIVMPGSGHLRGAFGPFQVLRILDARGKVLEQNYFFCEHCHQNTGEMIHLEPIKRGACTFFTKDFKCQACGRIWRRENT
jgi:hypothetical protein